MSTMVAGQTVVDIASERSNPLEWDDTNQDIEGSFPKAYTIDPSLFFEEVLSGAPPRITAESERLIYSNTLGTSATLFPTNLPVSDDIAIIAANGCNLSRYRFKVMGKVLPTGSSGPYTVTYGLYSNCPLAVGSTNAQRDVALIPGTSGMLSFDDDSPRLIEHVIDPTNPVAIPTNFYLSLRFSRSNCGTVVGSPAMVGFSGDIWDFPGFPCNGFLGGFPQLPHASFWAEFFGDQNCKEAHLAYKSARASGGTATIGANIQGADDIKLLMDGCRLVSYEVVVRGAAIYNFDLRRACDGQVIPGTQRTFQVSSNTIPLLQVARFDFDPPIVVPESFFLGFRCSTNSCGIVIAGIEPVVGQSSSDYFFIGLDGCAPALPISGVQGTVNASIVCDGPAATGACCDWRLPNADGETACHQVPKINCFGLDTSLYGSPPAPNAQRLWLEGMACDPDPFPHSCGVFACCKPDDTCENLTKNQCNAAEPPDRPRKWQQGEYCGEQQQECPFVACLALQGDCLRVHEGTGCSDPFCCKDVCDFDSWCCLVEWDEICLRWADEFCPRSPSNDQCAPEFPIRGFGGAIDIPVPGVYFGTNTYATINKIEPGFCCHEGTGICQGPLASNACLTNRDCDWLDMSGTCVGVEPMPGDRANGTVWHKFVATNTTARISTCGSKALDLRFADSLMQVFAVRDASSDLTACNTLISMGCNDEAGQACPDDPTNSQICVSGLIPGHTYYVMLGSKLEQFRGRYRIEITAPCQPQATVPGDFCFEPIAVSDGVTPFDTTGATFDCPAATCSPNAQNDLWFNYTATCSGEVTFSTCGAGNPDTNIAVYDNCAACPTVNELTDACNQDNLQAGCITPARVVVPVSLGQCLKVRIADEGGIAVSGDLTITCNSGDCDFNDIPDDQDIAACPPSELYCRDCNANGLLDGCDIFADYKLDLNFNGRIDACETCPPGLTYMMSPPNRVIDARRPHSPGDTNLLEGIETIQVAGFPGAHKSCWSLCETDVNPGLHPPYPPDIHENDIVSIVEDPPGTYDLSLKRPITPGETTIFTYKDDQGEQTEFRLTAHPGNVDGTFTTQPSDVLTLIDVLNGVRIPVWGLYSTDCDHSGLTAPADILCVIDLLNAGWNGTSRPATNASCP